MKKNTKYIALLAFLGAFVAPVAHGMWRFGMPKWKKEMMALYEKGHFGDLGLKLRSLENQENPTKQEKEMILFLTHLIGEE